LQGELTGNFDPDMSVNIHGLTAEFKQMSLASQPASSAPIASPAVVQSPLESQDDDDDPIVSMPVVKLLVNAKVLDFAQIADKVWPVMKKHSVGQSDSAFVDASTQALPIEFALLKVGGQVSIDCRNLKVQRLCNSANPKSQVAIACDAIDPAKRFVLKVSQGACPWEYYCAKRLMNKLEKSKVRASFGLVTCQTNSNRRDASFGLRVAQTIAQLRVCRGIFKCCCAINAI